MKFLVVGCGSIGKRHIKNLISMGYKDVVGCDADQERLNQIKTELGAKISNDYSKSLKDTDAVLVCTPNHLHTRFAVEALKEGKHVFIEKPMSHELKGLDEIKRLSKEKNLVVQIGCNLRHHSLLKQTKKQLETNKIGKIKEVRIEFGSYFPSWRPGQDHLKNFGSHKSMGGGIILDDIHEIDYAIWLFGEIKNISCKAQKLGDVTIDTEDTADLEMETKTGTKIRMHMDYLQKEPKRVFKITGEKGTIQGDLNKGENGQKFDYNPTYIDEMKEFIECIQKNKKPGVSYEEGLYDLKVALAAKKSAEEGKVITI